MNIISIIGRERVKLLLFANCTQIRLDPNICVFATIVVVKRTQKYTEKSQAEVLNVPNEHKSIASDNYFRLAGIHGIGLITI